jgi:gliding motility-associated-like protein
MLADGDRLNVGERESVQMMVNVLFDEEDTTTVFKNVADISGISAVNGNPVNGKSQDGLNPSPNSGNDSIANPTPIVIKHKVKTASSAIFIPDGFSPNGDQVNDYFVIENPLHYKIDVAVYNRWGNIVFEMSDYDNSWDGKAHRKWVIDDSNGVPDGTYFYTIEYTDEQNKRHKIAHSLTIAR